MDYTRSNISPSHVGCLNKDMRICRAAPRHRESGIGAVGQDNHVTRICRGKGGGQTGIATHVDGISLGRRGEGGKTQKCKRGKHECQHSPGWRRRHSPRRLVARPSFPVGIRSIGIHGLGHKSFSVVR